jgi:hypothetical protein
MTIINLILNKMKSVHSYIEREVKNSVYVPRVNASSYNALMDIMDNNIPKDYTAWQNIFIRREIASLSPRSIVHYVEVNPEEFERFCDMKSVERNLDGLEIFMRAKVSGESFKSNYGDSQLY